MAHLTVHNGRSVGPVGFPCPKKNNFKVRSESTRQNFSKSVTCLTDSSSPGKSARQHFESWLKTPLWKMINRPYVIKMVKLGN